MKGLLLAAGMVLIAQGAVAQEGDALAGERAFKQCQACHSIQAADGTDIVKGGKVGPNLWGVVGRVAGTYEGFAYSDYMVEAGEAGLVWTEEEFSQYVLDPTKYLRNYLDDKRARGKMTFNLRKADDAPDIWAYLASVGPEGGEGS